MRESPAGDIHEGLGPEMSLTDGLLALWTQWSDRTALPESIQRILREVAAEVEE